jgi:hypothetical protein
MLKFPPINNQKCLEIVLPCQQAKLECEKIAIKSFKRLIAVVKQTIATECESHVRLFIPPTSPVRLNHSFKTFKELTSIFGLWRDKPTIHLQGPHANVIEESRLAIGFDHLL